MDGVAASHAILRGEVAGEVQDLDVEGVPGHQVIDEVELAHGGLGISPAEAVEVELLSALDAQVKPVEASAAPDRSERSASAATNSYRASSSNSCRRRSIRGIR
ncbi:hypothetical protein GCM10022199_08140 [Marihabitans asiaticum]